jgi:hypothetical protein
MAGNDLGIGERAALLALMAEGREVPNPELNQRYRIDLSGASRRKLNQQQLVVTRRDGRRNLHELTDKGWRWCADELAAQCPPRAGSAGGALYAVLAGMHRFLRRSDLQLADVFGSRPASSEPVSPEPTGPPPATPEPATRAGLEDRIRAAYRQLVGEPRGWVSLTDLRPLLDGAARDDVDATLRGMLRARRANLIPRAEQRLLTPADRAAAVRIGAEETHLLSIEDS